MLHFAATVALALLGTTLGLRTEDDPIADLDMEDEEDQGAFAASDRHSIGRVPVRNGGEGAEATEDWIVHFRPGAPDLSLLCKGRCGLEVHRGDVGLAFATVRGRDKLEELVLEHEQLIKLVEPDWMEKPELSVKGGKSLAALSVETAGKSQPHEDSLRYWATQRTGVRNASMTGRGVNIYVQSTGVRTSHMEFGGRAVPAIDLTESGPLWECRGAAACAQDFLGRGTHAAGIAGGLTLGIATEAIIHAVKVRNNDDLSKSSWYLQALGWVAIHALRPAVLLLDAKGAYHRYPEAIDECTSSGVTVLTSAGDDGQDNCEPDIYAPINAIVVGATDMLNKKVGTSNYGSCVDIWAPGDFIVSASPTSDTSLLRSEGTITATAFVAGGAALLLEGNASLPKSALEAHLRDSARQNFVRNLIPEDNNVFLWLGEMAPPQFEKMPLPPPECPSFAEEHLPDIDGDCKCVYGKFCSTNSSTMNCPTSREPGWGGHYFLYICWNCGCYGTER